jgi:glutamine amidotransferase
MAGLRERGYDAVLRERFSAGRPILGICLGLQLALESTDEGGGVAGLGLLPGHARRLHGGRVPRMGWAQVDDRGTYYFAHSYAAETECATAWSEGVVAEARLGSFIGCQFHPEKSGSDGARYLEEVLCRFRA